MSPPAAAHHFRRALVARFGERLKEARLFGSFARGEAHEESDVDVLVLIDGMTRADKIAAIRLASDVLIAEGVAIQCLAMSPDEFENLLGLESALASDIVREGVRL